MPINQLNLRKDLLSGCSDVQICKKINVAIFTFTCLQSLRMCLSVGKIDMFYETVEFPNKRIILASVALSYKSPQFVFPSEMAWPWWRHQKEAFLCYWPLCGEFTGHRWIPRTKASDRELWCFLLSTPDKNGWVNNRDAGIWDAIGPIMASLQWLCRIFIRKIINGPSSAEFSNIYASFCCMHGCSFWVHTQKIYVYQEGILRNCWK